MTHRTPGPWKVFHPKGKAARGIGPAPDYIVARTTPCRDAQGQHHAKANARLIAAAPDLLEALIKAREFVYGTWSSLKGAVGENNLVKPVLDEIDAAIAKAEGNKND